MAVESTLFVLLGPNGLAWLGLAWLGLAWHDLFHRAINIADEGAATCRGKPTPFNAPAAGRSVATVGEIALVVQFSIFIDETALRLGCTRGTFVI
jgi:hypothetical protein